MRSPFHGRLSGLTVCLLLFTGPAAFGQSRYQNLDILKGVPDDRIPAVMQAFNGFLGVECTHCHVEGKWESGEKPTFARTREMFRMRAGLNAGPLKDYAGIGCWTCHRGQPKPASMPPDMVSNPAWPADLKLAPEKQPQPAEEVYQNIQVFRGVPAGRLPVAMAVFTGSLGFTCADCHVANDWKSDAKPNKQTARQMMLMVRSTAKDYFPQSQALSCWTCHRGAASPERNAPPKKAGQ